jgi:predicted RNase H-like HicB family nuclease
MRHYIALLHKDADSDYGVSFPDLDAYADKSG